MFYRADINTAYVRKRNEKAIPLWFNIYDLYYFLWDMVDESLTIDHIIPLNHKKVCGLHCKDNWQLLSLKDNNKKANKFLQKEVEELIMVDLFKKNLVVK